MKIDRSNYETYFIDYLDRDLSLEEIDLLLDFLNENPDLKEELKGLEHIKVEESKDEIPGFNHLKKSDFDHPEIFVETCIRAIENDLNKQDRELFQHHLYQNPEHQKEYELFRATVSEPDPFIIFENKQQLKKKGRVLIPFYWYAAAAVVLLGLFLFVPENKKPTETAVMQVAQEITPTMPANEPTKQLPVEKPVIKTRPSGKVVPLNENITKTETIRIAESIEMLTPLLASVEPMVAENEDVALVPYENRLSVRPKSYSKYLTLEEYFAERKNENLGILGKFALNTLKKISGDKFDYITSGEGKVEKLEYNSKLLAFTIPLDN